MFDAGGLVAAVDVRDRVGAAAVADEQAVALGVIAGAGGARQDANEAAIGALGLAGGDALGHDGGAGVAADMDHLGAGVGLLVVVGDGHRIELAD